jgi:hypothetical protein
VTSITVSYRPNPVTTKISTPPGEPALGQRFTALQALLAYAITHPSCRQWIGPVTLLLAKGMRHA